MSLDQDDCWNNFLFLFSLMYVTNEIIHNIIVGNINIKNENVKNIAPDIPSLNSELYRIIKKPIKECILLNLKFLSFCFLGLTTNIMLQKKGKKS